jgi:calcium-dependent protein kinase
VVRIGTLKATGETFAVKTIRKVKVTKLEPLKREIEILQECDHPHIIKLIEVVEDEKSIHLVQELCTGGELFDRIIDRGHYTEHDAKNLLYKLLTAVNHCHTKHIVHRDLKPENFIFKDTSDDADVKVIDFGLSCYGDNDHHMHTRVGTPYYIAPEVLAKDYTAACDIWSLGVILYILLCGFPPFYGDSDPEIFNRVKAGKYDFDAEEWAEVSTQAKELIGKMLCMEYKGEAEGGGPARRPTAKECIDDPWFADVDADDSNHTKTVIKPETVKTLKAFVHHNKLKKAALGVIAHHMTENEIGDLRSLFEQMDTDKTGIISVEGLSKCMHAGGYRMLEVEVRSLIEGLDINGNHKIDYSEFLAATIKRNQFLRYVARPIDFYLAVLSCVCFQMCFVHVRVTK